MDFSERLIEHFAGHLRVPMVDRPEYDHHRRDAHDHVEMPDDEISIRQRYIHDDVAEEQTGEPTVDKGEDEPDGKQHRHPQVNVAAP